MFRLFILLYNLQRKHMFEDKQLILMYNLLNRVKYIFWQIKRVSNLTFFKSVEVVCNTHQFSRKYNSSK